MRSNLHVAKEEFLLTWNYVIIAMKLAIRVGLMTNDIQQKASRIKLLILDVDGVMTDGSIIVGADRAEMKTFNAHDGQGIKLLLDADIAVAIISSRRSPCVDFRANELGIDYVYQGQKNKVGAYQEILEKLQLSTEQTAYMGDDLPDLTLIRRSGLGTTVANAPTIMQKHADWISDFSGGKGAIRQLCEILLHAQQKYDDLMQRYL